MEIYFRRPFIVLFTKKTLIHIEMMSKLDIRHNESATASDEHGLNTSQSIIGPTVADGGCGDAFIYGTS